MPPRKTTVIVTPALKKESEPPLSTASPIRLTFKATIPTQEFGNISYEISENITTADDSADEREAATRSAFSRMKMTVALEVVPLATAIVQKARPALEKAMSKGENPDLYLQLNSPLYRWLRVAQPDLPVLAMDALLITNDSE